MKSLILSLALIVCGGTAFAQTTITGKVVDSKGIPMPGAKVQEKGTGTSVLTNMDGTFSIETTKSKPKLTATYVGWNTTTKKTEQGGDNVIKMGKSGWWSYKPDHYQWFLDVNVAFPGTNQSKFKSPAFGIMLGRLKNVGWYAKAQFNGLRENGYHNDLWLTGKTRIKYFAAGAGAIFRLGCPIHLYTGVGYHNFNIEDEMVCGHYHVRGHSYDYDLEGGPGNALYLDLGIMLRYKHIFVRGGLQGSIVSLEGDQKESVGNFGVGYIF